MTDIKKWKFFLECMNIDYSESNGDDYEDKLILSKGCVHQVHDNCVLIVFNKDGAFIELEGWGKE